MTENAMPQLIDGEIVFTGYQQYKQEATEIAENLRSMDVTEENVKEAKKVVAGIRQKIAEIDDERKIIKQQIMTPYEVFQSQIREITSIIDVADKEVRTKIREIEEKERDDKLQVISDMWDNYSKRYTFSQSIDFSQVFKKEYLNKGFSINKVRDEIVSELERIDSEIKAIQTMEDQELILSSYLSNLDLTRSIQLANNKKLAMEQAKKLTQESGSKQIPAKELKFPITLTIEATATEINELQDYLKAKGIKFTKA